MGKHLPGRPSPEQRGYDHRHRALRARWAPRVAAGLVDCTAPVCLVERDGGQRRIRPGQPWDLGHDETDRRRYAGPQHASCNRGMSKRAPDTVTPAVSPDAPFDPDAWA